MPRFFIAPPKAESASAGSIILDGENARHIAGSLRMRPGDALTLCDGIGTDYTCRISEIGQSSVTAEILHRSASSSEPSRKISLYQCLPKFDKLETIIQKTTELGVYSLHPVASSRCISKLSSDAWKKKAVRYQKIALEAAKQSGRGYIPAIYPPCSFQAAINDACCAGHVILFYEKTAQPLRRILAEIAVQQKPQCDLPIAVFVGPEGGFSPEEVELAVGRGAHIATLGPRILRTETAPIAALSIILYHTGEMEGNITEKEEEHTE